MKKIFFGLIFLFFDFYIELEASRIGLIPDFIGYILIYNGLTELQHESQRFASIKAITVIMAAFEGAMYLADLFGLKYYQQEIYFILGLLSLFAHSFILYYIIQGIKDIEINRSAYLCADTLQSIWALQLVCSVCSYLFYLIPAISLIAIIAGFVLGVMFLVYFYRASQTYYSV